MPNLHPRDPRLDFSETHLGDDTVAAIVGALADGTGLLLMGPPGVGKTMIARRLPGVLPEPTDHERAWIRAEFMAVQVVTRYTSPATERPLATDRPFRAPHHTVSAAGLAGQAQRAHAVACGVHRPVEVALGRCTCAREAVFRPGEAQLARFGVLMLDELTEFSRGALEALAAALRKMGATAPLIVATSTACPCGWLGSPSRACACTPGMIERYTARLRQACTILGVPFTTIEVPQVDLRALRTAPRSPSSLEIRAAVADARGLEECADCGGDTGAGSPDPHVCGQSISE